ncbi:NAD(P)H-binding protein [Catellatospora bangladeshensis]|uniref:NAD(P)-dependent oxidoreductase n=1 Tax=Catellatospora bangladeshensis TaxID=310355 RepID=A0A8J3NL53_9ACTN|nr:NAD(P)H-binding protein [Catellatospora bangladeshensis]GIF85150.1 NAD(P)-dependent oxidoreductase [Catellatospora bangladeshensis]
MSIFVTGASGQLGRLVVEGLLARVPADQVTAVVRDRAKAAPLAERGVRVHVADYDVPETFAGLFGPGDRVLLVSGSELGKDRVAQHRAVIDAAAVAGVALLAYTSAPGSLTAALADDHRATERVVLDSGLPYTLLRNNWYHEVITGGLGPVLAHGAVVQAAGDGRTASASRADYAAAAVAVLTGDGHQNRTYELNGDTAWSYAEYAAELSRQTGREIAYNDVTPEIYEAILVRAGLPEPLAVVLAEVDVSVSKGELAGAGDDLSRLIGRPTTPLADAVAAALRG